MLAAWITPETALWARSGLLDPRLLWASVALVGVLLLGALAIWWVDRWRKRPFGDRQTPEDQLASFRDLYDRGELSKEEFERIRDRLGGRPRREPDLPAPAGDTGITANPPPDPGRAELPPGPPPAEGIRPPPPPKPEPRPPEAP